MEDEMVDITIHLDKATARELKGMNKSQLLNRLIVLILRNRVQDETVARLERELSDTHTKLDKAESYVEQGRAMLLSVMERWYEYDV